MSVETENGTETRVKKSAAKKAPKRRYMAELAALQGRADMAVKILRRIEHSTSDEAKYDFVAVAIELLESE